MTLMVAGIVALPLCGSSWAATADGNSTEEEAVPRTGVRFVICSPSGISLPSPLYCKQGKTYKTIPLGSRTPSARLKPGADGTVKFWKEDPTVGVAAAKGKDAKQGAVDETKLPPPLITVKVPASADSKTLCILVPAQDPAKTQTYFLKESDFPQSGVHIINFSPYPLQMVTSKSGNFDDKKEEKIGFFQKGDGISKKNSWSYRGQDGDHVAFMLQYKPKGATEFKRVKASVFSVSKKQSQITVIVKEPTRDSLKMMSIQLTEPKTASPSGSKRK